MTMTIENNLDSVKVNQHTPNTSIKSFKAASQYYVRRCNLLLQTE